MNRNQSKYFNTAIRMDKALIELLEKKDFEYITIKEICEKAEVNRSTFYLHYENTSDLLAETTGYITNSFLSYFTSDKASIRLDFHKSDLKCLFFITPEYIVPYLTYIKKTEEYSKPHLSIWAQWISMVFMKECLNIFSILFLNDLNFPRMKENI